MIGYFQIANVNQDILKMIKINAKVRNIILNNLNYFITHIYIIECDTKCS